MSFPPPPLGGAFARALFATAFLAALTGSDAPAGPLITEFSAANDTVLYDEDGESSDWIEVHNPDGTAIDLGGWFLTRDRDRLDGWRLPSPLVLPPGGFLIVFASGKDRDAGELHADFRLDKAGGDLALVEPDGETIAFEYAAYPAQPDDFSFGLAQSGSVETLVLVPEDSACRLVVPTSSLGTTWTDPDFDDGGWRDAATGVGYERSSGYENLIGANADVEAETYNVTGTVYVRIPFTVDASGDLSRLTLRMKYDDGFVAWLNGVEVASGNAPVDPAWDATATGDHPDGQATVFEDFDLTARLGLLRPGRNVLAIQGLNGTVGSSDLLVLPRLEAEIVSDPGLGGPGYFRDPTPGTLNGSAAEQGLPAGAVRFSQPGRGFTGTLSVTLAVDSPSAEIRYTTNGDVPTASSPRFTGTPIAIGSSTLVRARAFEAGKAPGPVIEEAFLALDSSARSFSSDLPVVVMENFGGGPSASNGKVFTFFAFFEPDPATGRTTLDKPYALGTRGGWKVRGSSSSSFAKKSYSIEAWNESNRNKDIGPFGMPEESDWILSGRYTFDRALMRNPLIYRLSNEVGRYAVRTEFVELFKNDSGGPLSFSGDYDGVYTFMEKITRDRDRVDVERLPESVTSEPGIAGGYLLKIDRLDPGDGGLSAAGQTLGWVYPKERDVTPAQAAWMRDYLNNMNAALGAADFADPETGYARWLDPDAFVDHHLLNILTLNADALRLSTYLFKRRDGRVEMGPIWDFDRSMESTDGRDDNPETWQGGTNYFTYPWWNRLFADENFWQRYIDRWFELREGPFRTANVDGIIEEFAARLDEAQVRNFDRWPEVSPRFGSYRGEVNHLKDWLRRRLVWIDGQFTPRPSASLAGGVHPAGTTVTLTADLTGGRRIIYTLDGTDPRPSRSGGVIGSTTLLDEQAAARVLVPAIDPGTAWRGGDEPFDDGGWIAGTNGMGYDNNTTYDPFININLEGANAMQGVNTSALMRIRFQVDAADLASANALFLEMRYDDGFVAWLNGTRIASANAPGALSWNSSATQTNDDGAAVTFESFDVSGALGALRAGTNVLAIQGLNESDGSSDFLNQARLVAAEVEDPGGPGGTEYTGPIVLDASARLVARVFDPAGASSPNAGRTPVGSPWSAPIRIEYLVDEVPADSTNLAITEVMADPFPLGDGTTTTAGDHEFVELRNVGAQRVSLTGVRFTRGVDFVFPEAGVFSLAPGERAVVASNREAFTRVYGEALAARVVGEFAGALDNGGEVVELRGASGGVIRAIDFGAPGFPPEAGDGFSWVLIGGDPADGASWSASRSLLGTPGYGEPDEAAVPPVVVNEVLTNSVAPEVDVIELHNPTGASVDLEGWFLTDDLGVPNKFRIPAGSVIEPAGFLVFTEADFNDPAGGGASFALDSGGEEVFLVSALPDGTRTGHVDGFVFGDAAAGETFGRHVLSTGAVCHPPMVAPSFGAANGSPRVGPLVIGEIMFNPPGDGPEFIEIVNVSASPVPLAGVEVAGVGFAFDEFAPVLEPGALALVAGVDPAAFRAAVPVPAEVPVFGPCAGRLDNGGETVALRIPEPSGVPGEPDLMIASDTVAYDDDAPWPTGADGDGRSLERIVPDGLGSDPVHWAASADLGGSPGVAGGEPPADWRAAFFSDEELADPTISGILADADRDGLVNALEYVLGSDLRDPASSGRPEARLVDGGNGDSFVEIVFVVRDAAPEFDLAIEETSRLELWIDAGARFVEAERTSLGDGTSLIVMRRTEPLEAGTGDRLFIRLRVLER